MFSFTHFSRPTLTPLSHPEVETTFTVYKNQRAPAIHPESFVSHILFPRANHKICKFAWCTPSPNISRNQKKKPLTVLKSEINSLRLVIVNLQINHPVTHHCLEDCLL